MCRELAEQSTGEGKGLKQSGDQKQGDKEQSKHEGWKSLPGWLTSCFQVRGCSSNQCHVLSMILNDHHINQSAPSSHTTTMNLLSHGSQRDRGAKSQTEQLRVELH